MKPLTRPSATLSARAGRGSWLLAAAVAGLLLSACATAPPPQQSQLIRGTASWYGQEYAGRTTANGEIFDPLQLTAAHRTLPFGTVVDVKNMKTGQTVRVRINDRGPYIGNRMIDLSYAAAQQISLVEPGSGEVEVAVVKLGKGDREPPAPYLVTVPEIKPVPSADVVASVPAVVDSVQVVEEHAGVETRRQVSADGRRIENVPVGQPPVVIKMPPRTMAGRFVVQVGAFAQELNARLLQDQLSHLGEKSYIEHAELYRVRIGPFATRDEAIRMRSRLETVGLSAIVVTP